MEENKKYIDKEKLLLLPTQTKYDWTECIDIEDIKNFPEEDVVEVVRCKDCIYYQMNEFCSIEYKICMGFSDWLFTDPDDFCSSGIRRVI